VVIADQDGDSFLADQLVALDAQEVGQHRADKDNTEDKGKGNRRGLGKGQFFGHRRQNGGDSRPGQGNGYVFRSG